jgi:predicted RND superfamily exporter protein
MNSQFTRTIITRPWLVIAAILILTVVFGNGLGLMKAETDPTRDLGENLPAKVLYDKIDELFPSREMLAVGLAGDNLYSADRIAALHRLTERIEDIYEVESVLSPSNARIITADDNLMTVREAADPLPQTAAEAAAFRERLLSQPLYNGTIVSRNGKAMLLIVLIRTGSEEFDVAGELVALAADPARNEGFRLNVTGRPAANYWSMVTMGRDMSVLTMAALLIVIIFLALAFRSVRGVLIPLGVVICAVIWTLGLMGYIGIPITHSSEILPVLLIAIGVADGIHILRGYYRRAGKGTDRRQVVLETMSDLNRPVVLTSITTSVGFIALDTSGILSLMQLGMFAAFGVLSAMVFSVTFIPALLSLLTLPRLKSGRTDKVRFARLESLLSRYAAFLVGRNKLVLGVIGLIVVLAAFGASIINVEMSSLSFFRPDHPFRMATEAVNQNFAGVSNLIVVVEGEGGDAVKEPDVLYKMDSLERFLLEQPSVGAVQSMTGFIKQMNRVMHDDDPDDYRLPEELEQETGTELVVVKGREIEREVQFEVPGRDLVSQYLALYEMSGKPEDFANLVTYDYSTARINVFLNTDKASVLTDLSNRVRAFIKDNFGGLKAELTGMAELTRAVNDLVVHGQVWSILASLSGVFVVSSLVFRSPVLGMFATLPLFFCLFLNFGVMGLSRISLNVMTMVTASIAIGVGIDYAIHFVHRYQKERLAGLDYGDAVVATVKSSGLAILLNAVTVAGGFSALLFSEIIGVAQMGFLIALTMITSAFAAVTILPSIFTAARPKAFKSAAER